FLSSAGHHRDLHSFPTRRSSDLSRCAAERPILEESPVGRISQAPWCWQARPSRLALLAPQDEVAWKPPHPEVAAGAALEEDEVRSEEHTSELQSRSDLVCRLLLE